MDDRDESVAPWFAVAVGEDEDEDDGSETVMTATG